MVPSPSRAVEQRSWWQSPTFVRSVAVVVPLVVCSALGTVRDLVPITSAALVLVLCVVGVAATGDRFAGVVAAVSSGLSFDFFLTQPYLQLSIDDPDDVQAAVLLVLIGVSVTELALWGRRQQEQASLRSGYLDGVLSAAATVAEADSGPDRVVAVVGAHTAEVLGADSCRYVAGPVHDPRVAVLDRDGVLTQHGQHRDVERTGLPVDDYVAVEVRRSGQVIGHFLVTASTRVASPTREQCRVAVLLADQVAPLVDV
jgi:K+-sensing histidine kinase KdpD